MSIASFAIVIGVFEFLIGIPLLLQPGAASAWLVRLTKEPLLYRLVGAFFLVLCLLPLLDDPGVSLDLEGLIRLTAWWGTIKCLVICWWPGGHSRLAESLLTSQAGQRFFGTLAVTVGVLFVWAGLVL